MFEFRLVNDDGDSYEPSDPHLPHPHANVEPIPDEHPLALLGQGSYQRQILPYHVRAKPRREKFRPDGDLLVPVVAFVLGLSGGSIATAIIFCLSH